MFMILLIVGLIIGGSLISLGNIMDYWKESRKRRILGIIALVLAVVGLSLWGMQDDLLQYEHKINSFIITKTNIENAMMNAKMSDLEKIELVKQINQENDALEKLKTDVKKWQYFYLDESKVNELEPIRIKVGE